MRLLLFALVVVGVIFTFGQTPPRERRSFHPKWGRPIPWRHPPISCCEPRGVLLRPSDQKKLHNLCVWEHVDLLCEGEEKRNLMVVHIAWHGQDESRWIIYPNQTPDLAMWIALNEIRGAQIRVRRSDVNR